MFALPETVVCGSFRETEANAVTIDAGRQEPFHDCSIAVKVVGVSAVRERL